MDGPGKQQQLVVYQNFALLSLPPEIRREIFKYLLPSQEPFEVLIHPYIQAREELREYIKLFSVSKLVRMDAEDVLFGATLFVFRSSRDGTGISAMKTFPCSKLKNVGLFPTMFFYPQNLYIGQHCLWIPRHPYCQVA